MTVFLKVFISAQCQRADAIACKAQAPAGSRPSRLSIQLLSPGFVAKARTLLVLSACRKPATARTRRAP
jgi:hypothetical protein